MGVTEKYIQNSCLDFFRPFRALHQTLQLFSHTFALLLYGWGLATQPSKNGVCPKQLAYAYLISSAMIQNRAGQGRAGPDKLNTTIYQEDEAKEGDKVFIRNYFRQTLGSLILLLGNFPQPHIVVGMNIFLQYKTIRMV